MKKETLQELATEALQEEAQLEKEETQPESE
jgi:hypothetical protein